MCITISSIEHISSVIRMKTILIKSKCKKNNEFQVELIVHSAENTKWDIYDIHLKHIYKQMNKDLIRARHKFNENQEKAKP